MVDNVCVETILENRSCAADEGMKECQILVRQCQWLGSPIDAKCEIVRDDAVRVLVDGVGEVPGDICFNGVLLGDVCVHLEVSEVDLFHIVFILLPKHRQ